MPDHYPDYTPYDGVLPIPVLGYLAGHQNRELLVRPIAGARPGDHQFCAYLLSEHGWALMHPRVPAATEFGARVRMYAETIVQVMPVPSSDRTRWA